MNFVLRLVQSDRYIRNIVRMSDSGLYSPVDYTTKRGEAFVFPEECQENYNMRSLWSEHIDEPVDRESNIHKEALTAIVAQDDKTFAEYMNVVRNSAIIGI